MAKVLTSISLDAPASPVSAGVNDTFAFSGTPGFTGSGGVQRYDFKWEVNDGGGYVTIGASGTGLITAGTNPIVNTNSQTQNSITVTCDQAGSHTIRMVGAPVSGGAYTVLSATQTVEVSSGPVTTPQAIPATAIGTPVIARVSTRFRALSATAVATPTVATISTRFLALAATALGAAVLSPAQLIIKAIAATAIGVASLTAATLALVGMSATAVGTASLSAAIVLGQAMSAAAIGVATLAAEFIEGVADVMVACYRKAAGCVHHMRRR